MFMQLPGGQVLQVLAGAGGASSTRSKMFEQNSWPNLSSLQAAQFDGSPLHTASSRVAVKDAVGPATPSATGSSRHKGAADVRCPVGLLRRRGTAATTVLGGEG